MKMKATFTGLLVLLMGLGVYSKTNLKEDFETYRRDTLNLLSSHLENHPDCELQYTIERVQNASFLFVEWDKKIDGFTFPPQNLTNIFFSSDVEWNRKKAIILILHEATHISKNDKGSFVCGQDAHPKPGIPVCRLFGGVQYQSRDISAALREHLDKELNEDRTSRTDW